MFYVLPRRDFASEVREVSEVREENGEKIVVVLGGAYPVQFFLECTTLKERSRLSLESERDETKFENRQ